MFEIGDHGYTFTDPNRTHYTKVKVVHTFVLDRQYYVIATREEPDLILHVRDDGNLFKEDPDAKAGT